MRVLPRKRQESQQGLYVVPRTELITGSITQHATGDEVRRPHGHRRWLLLRRS
jgi:hypothetical protein